MGRGPGYIANHRTEELLLQIRDLSVHGGCPYTSRFHYTIAYNSGPVFVSQGCHPTSELQRSESSHHCASSQQADRAHGWDEVQIGGTYKAKVVKIMDYGAFVELAGTGGTQALVHISEMAVERVPQSSHHPGHHAWKFISYVL